MNFEKFAQEGNQFLNELAANLGHPDERNRASMLLRAVFYTLRDSITMGESLDFISPLPMTLKALYVDQWKYHESPPKRLRTVDEFCGEVELAQRGLGEREFNWRQSTADLVRGVFQSLDKYIPEGEWNHLASNVHEDVRSLFPRNAAAGGQ